MNSLFVQRKLQFLRKEVRLRDLLQKFANYKNHTDIVNDAFFQQQLFKLLALSLPKQIALLDGIILAVLSRDKVFLISGKIQRELGKLFNREFLQAIYNFSAMNWDKLDLITNYPLLDFNQQFIIASRIALIKIIYANFANGLILHYLSLRYAHFMQANATIDDFWATVPANEIQTGIEQVSNYLLPVTKNVLLQYPSGIQLTSQGI